MSVKERTLVGVEKRIRQIFQKEKSEQRLIFRGCLRLQRYALMLYHEMINDDLAIRAQSFSYLTLFSILPILAGLFLLFGMMSQWGPVQKGFQDFLVQLFQPIPEDYREVLLEFINSFKDEYLQKVQQKSASIGILALGVMVWITAKVFFNIEDLMNRVWLVKENRAWTSRIQNFTLSAILLPLFAAITFSLPMILESLFSQATHWGPFLNQVLPLMMSFSILGFMYRFFPNARVNWKSAIAGAFFSATLFAASNIILKIYFKFGTESAYGKVAVLPIVAFFIYVMWYIFILGAEVSYLVQNHHIFTGKKLPNTTLAEANLILEILDLFALRFEKGSAPMGVVQLANHFKVSIFPVQKGIRFLLSQKILIEAMGGPKSTEPVYALGIANHQIQRVQLIKDYLQVTELVQTFDSKPIFKEILGDFHQSRDKSK